MTAPYICQHCYERPAEWAEEYCQECWEEYADREWWDAHTWPLRHPVCFAKGLVWRIAVHVREEELNLHHLAIAATHPWPETRQALVGHELWKRGFDLKRPFVYERVPQHLAYRCIQLSWRWAWLSRVFPDSWIHIDGEEVYDFSVSK